MIGIRLKTIYEIYPATYSLCASSSVTLAHVSGMEVKKTRLPVIVGFRAQSSLDHRYLLPQQYRRHSRLSPSTERLNLVIKPTGEPISLDKRRSNLIVHYSG
jgi:hypothetical protein